MPWESIGSVDTGNWPDEAPWIEFSMSLALKYIVYVCGDPPLGCTLEMTSNDSELGDYPTLGVWSEYELPGAYTRCCEDALNVFNDAVDWLKLKDHFMDRLQAEAEVSDEDDS